MIDKCKELGIILKIDTEEYTSKTCGRCGNIKQDLKRSRVYECQKCLLIIDRDANGARNILMKNLLSCETRSDDAFASR